MNYSRVPGAVEILQVSEEPVRLCCHSPGWQCLRVPVLLLPAQSNKLLSSPECGGRLQGRGASFRQPLRSPSWRRGGVPGPRHQPGSRHPHSRPTVGPKVTVKPSPARYFKPPPGAAACPRLLCAHPCGLRESSVTTEHQFHPLTSPWPLRWSLRGWREGFG